MQTLVKAQRASLIFSLIAVAGVIVFGLAIGVFMGPPVEQIGGQERTSELVCLQLAFTPERAADVVLAFPEEARPAIADLLIPGDFTLAWGYGLLLFGLLGLLVVRLPGQWQQAGQLLMWAPLVASALDCVENLFLVAIVNRLVESPEVMVPAILTILGGSVATLKWIALSVVTPVFGYSGIVKAIGSDRRIGSWVVYVLLAVTLFSMVSKPIQDIPSCF